VLYCRFASWQAFYGFLASFFSFDGFAKVLQCLDMVGSGELSVVGQFGQCHQERLVLAWFGMRNTDACVHAGHEDESLGSSLVLVLQIAWLQLTKGRERNL
jgi:hypothetical protein